MRWLLLLGLWLSYLAFGAVAVSIAPLVAPIRADLDLSNAAIGSIMGAWQLVYIASAIPCGMLLDRLGARRALALGVGLIALSAACRALASDYWGLLAAVMLFGLGGPIVSSGAPKVVTSIFTGARRGLAMGIYMTGPTLGGTLALTLTHPLLLPLLEDSWRSVMLVWALVAIVALAAWLVITSAAYGNFRRELGPQDAADAPGGLASVRDIVAIPGVKLVLLMSVGVFLYNHGLNNWLPELLRNGGMSAEVAGYWAALPMLVGILGSLVIPRLATPPRRFQILLALAVSAGTASLLLQFTTPAVLTGALILQGLVRASLMTVLILTLMELPGLDNRQAGTASGLFFSAAEVGGVLGPLGLGVLFDVTGTFTTGLYGLTLVAAALAAATLILARQSRSAGAQASLSSQG